MEGYYEKEPRARILVLPLTPMLLPEQFQSLSNGNDAVVLKVYATGTSPKSLNNVIKSLTQKGVPVFFVSDNVKDSHGILSEDYSVQHDSKKAGAISLEKVNVNDLPEIVRVIQEKFSEGKRGADLGEAVRDFFSYKEEYERPVTDWDDDTSIRREAILLAHDLRRAGLHEDEIKKEMERKGFI